MNETRVNRVVEWLAVAFLVVVVVGLPAALIANAVGHSWPASIQIAGFVAAAFLTFSFLLGLFARIPPVRRFLEVQLDPNSRFVRVMIRLFAVQGGDAMAGALAGKHERESDEARSTRSE